MTVRFVLLLALTASLVVGAVPLINSAGEAVSGATGVDVPKVDLTTDTSLNVSRAERLTFEKTNEERLNHSVGAVEYSPELSVIARKHSQDMAKHGYIGHTEPDGDGVLDRLRRHPNPCGGGSAQHIAGENAGGAYWMQESRVFGESETVFISTEDGVANALVTAWMNSDRHRENILIPEWDYVGIGIAINESTDHVYATQLFC